MFGLVVRLNLENRLVGCLYVDKYEKLHYFITFYKTSQPSVS